MKRLVERVQIRAPVRAVWNAVHVDVDAIPGWSENLVRGVVVGGGPPRLGSELRYTVRLPAGRIAELILIVREHVELRRSAGSVRSGPMHGTWVWSYRVDADVTEVTYEAEVAFSGLARLASGVIEGRLAEHARRDLLELKRYVEGRAGAGSATL